MSGLNFFPYTSQILSFSFCLPLLSTSFLFRFLFYLITDFELEFYGIFRP